MPKKNSTTDDTMTAAIRTVGVGKHGSRNLSSDQVQAIGDIIKEGSAEAIVVGAFFGALFAKGISPEEKALENVFENEIFSFPLKLVSRLAPEAPSDIQNLCASLLAGKELDYSQAHRLGD